MQVVKLCHFYRIILCIHCNFNPYLSMFIQDRLKIYIYIQSSSLGLSLPYYCLFFTLGIFIGETCDFWTQLSLTGHIWIDCLFIYNLEPLLKQFIDLYQHLLVEYFKFLVTSGCVQSIGNQSSWPHNTCFHCCSAYDNGNNIVPSDSDYTWQHLS